MTGETEQWMIQKKMVALLVLGLFLLGAGTSVLTVYYTDYEYSRKKRKYAEFWAGPRVGGGDMSSGTMYTRDIPISGNTSLFRVIHLSFNVSKNVTQRFWLAIQLIAGLNTPSTGYYRSNWIQQWDPKEWNQFWKNYGNNTPRTLTIDYMETVLQVRTQDHFYNLSLGRIDDICFNETEPTGLVHWRHSEITYKPEEGYVFYVADPNRTVLQLGRDPYDTAGLWNFSLIATWNVSFTQPYGSNAYSKERAVVAHWRFSNQSHDQIHVTITFDNSHHHPLIPVYTMVQRPPWPEATTLTLGSLLIVGVYLYKRRQKRKEQ